MVLDELIRKVNDLPPLPRVVGRLLTLCPDPEVPPLQIIKAVELDPALTMKVLKLCNSPFYGLPRTITSLSNAVVYLGTDVISHYVMAWCLAGFFHRDTRGHTLDPDAAWRHSVGAGVTARVLAEAFEPSLASACFTCGLLHDIGKTILDELMPQEWSLIASLEPPKRGAELAEVERTALGFDHGQVGAALAEHWSLPETVVEAIHWHHDPAKTPEHLALTSLVNVADILCVAVESGRVSSVTNRDFQPAALRVLQVHASDVLALGSKIDERVQATIDAFLSV